MDLLYTAHCPAGDGPHPTVLALHGRGASAHDLVGLAPLLHRGRALVLCPQGPLEMPIASGLHGYAWLPPSVTGATDAATIERASDQISRFLDGATTRYPVDPRKLYVLGFSQGGVLAYAQLLRHPRRVAGAIVLSSWLPDELIDAADKDALTAPHSLYVAHGTQDELVPIARGRAARERLIAAGASPTYREHGGGHEIPPDVLRDLVSWLDRAISPIALL
jgi:phospholipase/carboxylesterase